MQRKDDFKTSILDHLSSCYTKKCKNQSSSGLELQGCHQNSVPKIFCGIDSVFVIPQKKVLLSWNSVCLGIAHSDQKGMEGNRKEFPHFQKFFLSLKGTWQRGGFFGVFCKNRCGIGPSHHISSRSDFDFEFAEIFIIEKRLPDSPSRGVDKNAYRYKYFQTFESINGVSTLQPRLLFG